MKTNIRVVRGTPTTIEGAIANALEDIDPMMPRVEQIKIIKGHIRDFAAQRSYTNDDMKTDHFIELFRTLFGETAKG